jgi:hypothetical protein
MIEMKEEMKIFRGEMNLFRKEANENWSFCPLFLQQRKARSILACIPQNFAPSIHFNTETFLFRLFFPFR